MSDNYNPSPTEPEANKPVEEEYPAVPQAEQTEQADYTQGQADYGQQPQYDQSAYAQPQEGQDYSQAAPQYDQTQYAQPQYDQSQYAQPQYDQTQYVQPGYDQTQYAQQQYDQTAYAQPGYDQSQYAQPQYDQAVYAQPGYDQTQYGQAQYGQAGGGYAVPAGTPQKSRLTAGLLGILLSGLAAHNFYLGFTGKAILQLVLNIITFGMASLWPFIEGILYLVAKDNPKWSVDANNVPLRD